MDISSVDSLLAAVWQDDGDVFLNTAEATDQTQPAWSSPINLSQSAETASDSPQTAVDKNKRVHIVWSEQTAKSGGSSAIFHRSCLDGHCTEPATLSAETGACASQINSTPAMKINGSQVMIVWGNASTQLSYSTWNVDETPSNAPSSCFKPDTQEPLTNPRLNSMSDGGFVLAFEGGSNVFMAFAKSQNSGFEIAYQEPGHSPEVLVDAQGSVHLAWCGADGKIHHRRGESQPTVLAESNCLTRPAVGEDANGIIHLV